MRSTHSGVIDAVVIGGAMDTDAEPVLRPWVLEYMRLDHADNVFPGPSKAPEAGPNKPLPVLLPPHLGPVAQLDRAVPS